MTGICRLDRQTIAQCCHVERPTGVETSVYRYLHSLRSVDMTGCCNIRSVDMTCEIPNLKARKKAM